MYGYGDGYPDYEAYGQRLRRGLSLMVPGFMARLCGVCNGETAYSQLYTAGCGMGTYRSMGECDYCNGTGLKMCDAPAPKTVVNQVLVAADQELEAAA